MATGDDPVTLVLQNTDLNTPTDSGGEIIFKGTKNCGNPLFFGAIAGKIISKMIANENTNLDLNPYKSVRFS